MRRNFGLRILWVVALGLALALAGCGDGRATTGRTPPQRNGVGQTNEPSSASTIVDGLTGRTAVRYGKRAMTEVKELGVKRQQELDEVLRER